MELETQTGLIRDMALAVRPISRLSWVGVEGLSDIELLALALGSRSLQLTESLLKRHPLRDLVGMKHQRLASLEGVGRAGAAALLAAAEITRRVDKSVDSGLPVMVSVGDVAAQAIDIRDKKKEYLLAFFLNARHQLIAKETISVGTLTASLAHPREIFAPAIGKAAAGVILVHNHPSGDPAPSDEDQRLTKRVAQAGFIMGIELLDHLIVAERGVYSFKTAGAL